MATTTTINTTAAAVETTVTTGLPRMSEDDFENEFSSSSDSAVVVVVGTPRPGTDDTANAAATAAATAAVWSFSQAAKHAAVATKRRRSPKARTYYCMAASRQVKTAFDELEKQIKQTPELMSNDDFKLLKQGISNFRVKLNVHDGITFNELRQLRIDVSQQEQAAELATHNAFIDRAKTPEGEQAYLDAKQRYLDLKQWSDALVKEVAACRPKPKYTNIGNGLFRHDLSNQEAGSETPAGVPSQHAQIAPSSAKALYNILTPSTIRRTFISMSSLTDQIRKDVVDFLKDNHRRKDRAEVVKQIKEACMAKAAAKKLN
jgi:septum formation inhibitor MinC